MKKAVFVIEHLEPELWDWCIIEYKHISQMVGKEQVWFTNIKKEDIHKLAPFGKVTEQSVKELGLKDACILDPEAPETLTPLAAKEFTYFVFGGILGDHPPKKRTEEELTCFLKDIRAFDIGKEQMSTDNAVFVTKEIIEGKNLSNLKFQDSLEIEIDEIESTILPFRYTLVQGKPLISEELVRFIKKRDKVE